MKKIYVLLSFLMIIGQYALAQTKPEDATYYKAYSGRVEFTLRGQTYTHFSAGTFEEKNLKKMAAMPVGSPQRLEAEALVKKTDARKRSADSIRAYASKPPGGLIDNVIDGSLNKLNTSVDKLKGFYSKYLPKEESKKTSVKPVVPKPEPNTATVDFIKGDGFINFVYINAQKNTTSLMLNFGAEFSQLETGVVYNLKNSMLSGEGVLKASPITTGRVTFTRISPARMEGIFSFSGEDTLHRAFSASGSFDVGKGALRPSSIVVVDPVCETGDCKGALAANDTLLKTELVRLKAQRTRAVSDGVTMLAFKVPVRTGKVKFKISSLPGQSDFGQLVLLSPRDTAIGAHEVLIREMTLTSPTDSCAIVAYRSPLQHPYYVAGSQQPLPLPVKIEVSDSTGWHDEREIVLVPPPLVLVHGLWSDPEAWSKYEEVLGGMYGYDIARVDHRVKVDIKTMEIVEKKVSERPKTGGKLAGLPQPGQQVTKRDTIIKTVPMMSAISSFDPSVTSPSIDSLINTITRLKQSLRASGCAVSQVDVIGHSMGGLIARGRMKYINSAYKRPDNYNKGDFHKLITLGTPHHGTPIANFLLSHQDSALSFLSFINSGRSQTLRETLATHRALGGRPLGDAHIDLQTGSRALRNLGYSEVPCHAVVTTDVNKTSTGRLKDLTPDGTLVSYGLNFVFSSLVVSGTKPTINSILQAGDEHDGIVPCESQCGGLQTACSSRFAGTNHIEQTANFLTPNKESKRILNELIPALLQASPQSAMFDKGFPTPK